MRVIGRKHKQIFADFLDDAVEKRLVTFATEENPAGLQVIARRMADQVFGAIAWIFKVVVHTLHVRWYPANAAFEKGKFEIPIAIEQAGAKHACQPGHDRQNAG